MVGRVRKWHPLDILIEIIRDFQCFSHRFLWFGLFQGIHQFETLHSFRLDLVSQLIFIFESSRLPQRQIQPQDSLPPNRGLFERNDYMKLKKKKSYTRYLNLIIINHNITFTLSLQILIGCIPCFTKYISSLCLSIALIFLMSEQNSAKLIFGSISWLYFVLTV